MNCRKTLKVSALTGCCTNAFGVSVPSVKLLKSSKPLKETLRQIFNPFL